MLQAKNATLAEQLLSEADYVQLSRLVSMDGEWIKIGLMNLQKPFDSSAQSRRVVRPNRRPR